MKIRIIVKFDDHERQFFVACGTGEKTFKWLGNVASQRYASAVPNGNLRRREDYCAISDAAQFQTFKMILPSGHTPSPMEFLTEHLHDEDTVIIELCSRLPVDTKTGTPMQTQFATLAYSTSQEKLGFDPEEMVSEDGSRMGLSRTQSLEQLSKSTPLTSPSGRSSLHSASETHAQKLAKANFLRIMLKSQVLNEDKIWEELEKHWKVIVTTMKVLKSSEIPHIKKTFFDHWDVLIDIFEYYCSNNPNHHSHQVSANSTKQMIEHLSLTKNYYQDITTSFYLEKHDFINLLEDANVFPAIQLASQANLIFTRTCQVLTTYSQAHHFTQSHVNALNFTGFLISLLFCSQLKYNDTLDAKSIATHAYDSIDRLIFHNFVTLARHLHCRALLKHDFLSVEVLSKIRDQYELLQTNFDKIASKVRDVPLTISMEDMLELLYNASLVAKKDDMDYIKVLLIEIRKGTVYGRDIDNIPSESMQNLLLQQKEKQNQMNFYHYQEKSSTHTYPKEDTLYPSYEFTFAEFIEGIARTGHYHYTKTTPLQSVITQPIVNLANGMLVEDTHDIAKIHFADYLVKGIQDVCDFLTGKKLKPQIAGAKKNKKGGNTTTNNAVSTASAEAK